MAQEVHDGMTLSIVHTGQFGASHGVHTLKLLPGQISLFWAAIPRHITQGSSAETQVQIPLGRYLAWRMPESLTARLLSGQPLFGLAGDTDEIAAAKWEDELSSEDTYLVKAAELEIQACVLRMARSAPQIHTSPPGETEPTEALIRWLLARLNRPFSVEEAARAVGLPASAAMRAFKRRTGQTIVSFVTHHRLAKAKSLLLTTTHPVGMIALACGFGSERRFFEVFRQSCGMSPREYRRQTSPSAEN